MRGAFHLSLAVLVHYRSMLVFSLTVWSRQVPTEFHVLRGTQEASQDLLRSLNYGTVTLFGATFQTLHLLLSNRLPPLYSWRYLPLQPLKRNACRLYSFKVWTLPSSLTATKGITFVFFSSCYLDVSVHRLTSTQSMCSTGSLTYSQGLPHSGIPGS